jgi:beta-N-acetylhexosaminidase
MPRSFLPLCFLLLLAFAPAALSAGDSLRYRIAQMLVVGFRGTELTPENHIYSDVKNLHIGGVILFDYDAVSKTRGRNITSPEQVKKLCGDLQNLAPSKLIISIDQEGGKVNRLKASAGFPATVSARYLGRLNNADTTRYYAKKTAELLKGLGFNLNFIPCVDLDVNPHCPVIGKIERSFSAKPDIVLRHSRIWIEEHRRQGVLTAPKHFPGHGSSAGDSHLGLTDVTQTWTRRELIPYRELIKGGACDMVMVAHVFNKKLDAQHPATLSKKVVGGILRGELKFGGLVITDDMAMGAIVDSYTLEAALEKAISAGVDMLILSNNGKTYDPQAAPKAVDIVERLVRSGRISEQRIREAHARVAAVKGRL